MQAPRTINMKLKVDTKKAERRLDKFRGKMREVVNEIIRFEKISRRILKIDIQKAGIVWKFTLTFKGKKTEAR